MLDDVLVVLKSKIGSDQGYNCEVILVDDGSKDKTIEEYKKLVSSYDQIQSIDFKLIRMENNSGKGRAVSEVKKSSASFNILIFVRECYQVWG